MSTGGIDRNSEADRVSMAKIDATGWGLFFLWVGVALVEGVGWGMALLGTGAISLGVQFARRQTGLLVDRWSVGFGTCLSVAGLVQWLDVPLGKAPLPAWAVPAAFAALGIAILFSTWARRRSSKSDLGAPMKVLTIYAHHNPRSFCNSVLERFGFLGASTLYPLTKCDIPFRNLASPVPARALPSAQRRSSDRFPANCVWKNQAAAHGSLPLPKPRPLCRRP